MTENETSKVEEETQVAPTAPASDAPLTRDELVEKLEQLSTRAKAAGLSPIQAMFSAYARRGMAVIDGFLSALDESTPQKPSAPEAPDDPTKKKA